MKTFFGIACLLFWAGQIHAELVRRPLEAYGDSITAGFLDKTELVNPPPVLEVLAIWTDLASGHWDRVSDTSKAWPAALAGLMGDSGTVQDVAIPGNVTSQLLDQVKSVKSTNDPARAFFFIGHNDLCGNGGTPEEVAATYRDQMDAAIAEWDSRHQGADAYLVPVADMPRVYKSLDGYVWHRGAADNITCNTSWNVFFPYCRANYKLFRDGKLAKRLSPQIDAMNKSLGDLSQTWSTKSNRNNFHYLEGVGKEAFEPDYFAVDCYHPSKLGQARLAKNILDNITKEKK